MSSVLPGPADDYTAPDAMDLTEAAWNAAFNSIGTRLRALEGVRADFEGLIAVGTGQALASIAANVEPELVSARAALAQLQADTALAEDIVQQIVTGSVPLSAVDGLATALAAKAPVASPALTGTPTAPTAPVATATDQIATTAFVSAALARLIGAAPGQLDTLDELAAALGDDANFASATIAALAARLRVDAAQTLTPAEAAQGRANLGVQGKASLRNRHLNPAFQICHDRATGATIALSTIGYAFDGVYVTVPGGGVLTCSQAEKTTPGGSPYRFRAAVTTADTSIASSDAYVVEFPIEGIDVIDLRFGTSAAKPFVWRGVINAPAGTYGLSFRNADASRSFVTTFTISSGEAGTDKLVTAVVPGDTAGTWNNNATGLSARICLSAGSTFQTTATGAWQSGNYTATPAQTNIMASTSNTVEIADIGLYIGTDVPTWELPEAAEDLRRCQRQYVVLNGLAMIGLMDCQGATYRRLHVVWPVPMRAAPAVTSMWNTGTPGTDIVSAWGGSVHSNVGNTTSTAWMSWIVANARL